MQEMQVWSLGWENSLEKEIATHSSILAWEVSWTEEPGRLQFVAKSLQSCPTLCDPIDGSHQAPPSLGFSRQEHWSGLPFPSPMHDNEKWKWSCSVVSDSQRPHGLQPTRLLHPWDFPVKSTGVGCHCLLWGYSLQGLKRLRHDFVTKQQQQSM